MPQFLFGHGKIWAWQKTGLGSESGGMEIHGRNTSNLRYTDDTILLAEIMVWNDFCWKWKKISAKAGLHLKTKKTKIITRKEIQIFNVDNVDFKTVKRLFFFLHWFSRHYKGILQPRNLEKAETPWDSNGRIGDDH